MSLKIKPTSVSLSLRRADASGAKGSGSREVQRVRDSAENGEAPAQHTTVPLLNSFPIFKNCKVRKEQHKLEINAFK